jgi:MoaE-MoaD fusion protein
MQVTVLFFGMLKDITRTPREQIEIEPGSTLSSLWNRYASSYPQIAAARASIRLALNHEFSTDLSSRLAPGDEIAFLPPVSGGMNQPDLFTITRQPIDVRALAALVQTPHDGAVATFEGVVRDNTNGRPTGFLEYEGYEAMAVRMMADLAADLQAHHKIGRVAMVHRLGRLEIGEASVAIVVAAPHRKPAFEACLEAINRLKSSVPIWKKEHFEGGEVWVEGAWDDNAVHP